MAKKPKILSNTAKGLGKLAGETVKEAASQTGQAAEEAAKEVVGVGGSDQSQPAPDVKKKDKKEIADLQKSIKKGPQAGGRDVDQEIQQVKKEKKERDIEEERFLEEMKKQREEEKEQARKEAQMAGAGQGPLEATGSKEKRGTALIKQRGKGREIKGGKN